MKKMTLILASLMMAALSANAQISKVLLQHQGNVTMYEPEDIQKAIDAAVDGDTIFLNKGDFPGFTVDRKISLIGTGTNTVITSDVYIDIPNTPTLSSHLLEGLKLYSPFDADIFVNKPINGLKIKKCTFSSISFNGMVNDVLIDRCRIERRILLSEYINKLDVNNSQINHIEGDTKTDKPVVNCKNCYLYGEPVSSSTISNAVSSSNSAIKFIDSWINNYNKYTVGSNVNTQKTYVTHYSATSIYLNCIVENKEYGTYNDYCWPDFGKVSHDRDIALLQRDGYVGTDGTVVGEMGGATPYTLVTTAPKVTEKDIQVSTDMKKLSVNIKVTPN